MTKKSKMIIAGVSAIVLLVAIVAIRKRKNRLKAYGEIESFESFDYPASISGIPKQVQDHLRDFAEGESMMHMGKNYTVSNGAWVVA